MNEGWSYGDLLGELVERGLDPAEFSPSELRDVLDYASADRAAQALAGRR